MHHSASALHHHSPIQLKRLWACEMVSAKDESEAVGTQKNSKIQGAGDGSAGRKANAGLKLSHSVTDALQAIRQAADRITSQRQTGSEQEGKPARSINSRPAKSFENEERTREQETSFSSVQEDRRARPPGSSAHIMRDDALDQQNSSHGKRDTTSRQSQPAPSVRPPTLPAWGRRVLRGRKQSRPSTPASRLQRTRFGSLGRSPVPKQDSYAPFHSSPHHSSSPTLFAPPASNGSTVARLSRSSPTPTSPFSSASSCSDPLAYTGSRRSSLLSRSSSSSPPVSISPVPRFPPGSNNPEEIARLRDFLLLPTALTVPRDLVQPKPAFSSPSSSSSSSSSGRSAEGLAGGWKERGQESVRLGWRAQSVSLPRSPPRRRPETALVGGQRAEDRVRSGGGWRGRAVEEMWGEGQRHM